MQQQPTGHTDVEIDVSLYSRQLYVMGREAQLKMATSNVLIAGLNGLGVEVAKNVILAGVKSVTLVDHKTTTYQDLSSQFYLSEKDIGKNRAEVSAPQLAELNPYVHVSVTSASSNLLNIVEHGHYNVVVIIDYPFSTQVAVSEYCHAHNIAVIVGDVRGVTGQIFCDFGESFVVHDLDGEPAANALIAGITKDTKGLVSVLEETRHNLNTGDVITFSDIIGMEELNGVQCKVDVKDPFTFEIDINTSNFHSYERSGYLNQIKQPTTLSFQSLVKSWSNPNEFIADSNKTLWYAHILHFCYYALHDWVEHHNQQYPRPGNRDDANAFYSLVQTINAQIKANTDVKSISLTDEELTNYENFIKTFAMTSLGNLSPISAQIGGILGQEVLKACSGKFMPIKQWYYYESFDSLPEPLLVEDDVKPLNSRYDGQIVIYGQDFQLKLSNLKLFLVGAGAIGCEMLKNWAMMGISAPFNNNTSEGKVIVTDMDSIEKSNLSRQFLFRNKDINCLKSTTAINAVTVMNSGFKGIALEQKVATETEHIFNDDFYEGLDMVCTALDNVEARLYIDQKCLFYKKPMLESGTLGAKGHTQIVSPHQTENYGATRDPPEKSIPVCTLKHFPNQIEHTLQWSREWFEEIFKQIPNDINEYINNYNDFMKQLDSQPNIKLETLQRLKSSLVNDRPHSIIDCAIWARKIFEDLFSNRIKQLLHNFPLDRISSSGTPFWSGSKKPPTPVTFDPNDPLHADFIVSVATLRATVYNLPTEIDRANLLNAAANTVIEQFQPKADVKIAASDEELKAQNQQQQQTSNNTNLESAADLDRVCQSLLQSLPTPDQLKGDNQFAITVIEFEKDYDSHMYVITSASNLRARNYKIPEADLHKSRGIAGKITPAIATTTSLVTGSICMELYKLILQKPLNKLLNTFTNLAIPLFTSMEPEPPKVVTSRIKGKEWKWTSWDHIDINNPLLTVQELIELFENDYQLNLSMLSSGVTILYSDFMDRKKQTERKGLTLKQLVEKVTKKTVPADQRYLVFEVMATDIESDEDVELPHLRFRL
eukprot:gene9078-9832_t